MQRMGMSLAVDLQSDGVVALAFQGLCFDFSYDLLLLMTRADGIVMLPGWQASRGAQIENYVSMHFWMQGISKAVTEEIERIK